MAGDDNLPAVRDAKTEAEAFRPGPDLAAERAWRAALETLKLVDADAALPA
jgi:hypothetical protein